jgi:hypothetical protein
MRILRPGLAVLFLAAACSSSSSSPGGPSSGSGSGAGTSGTGTGDGTSGSGAGSGTGGDGSGAGSGTGAGSGSTVGSSSGSGTGTATGTMLPTAGNPSGSCTTLTVPAEAEAVDTSHSTNVVGSGTPESCTFSALTTALAKGGMVTFSCGDGLVTIPITATLTPPMSTGSQAPVNVVIDGGNKITLDGGKSVRILSWLHNTWRTNKDTLTLQHIQLSNGKATPTDKIPPCPASGSISNTMCSTGYDDGEGGALYMQDGNLRVIDSTFTGNEAALLGPDTGGGAIYLFGTGTPSYIAQSTFQNNTASNAGAIGMLWAGAFIVNSLFEGNSAVGTGANNNDATQCTCMNNGQNQIGSGGNGGAIYKDGGDGVNLTICGDQIQNNMANEFGAGIFLTADGSSAEIIIDDTVLKNNTTPIPYWQWCTGVSTDNPHASSGGSPSPIKSSFCGTTCSPTCSS